MLYEPRQAVHDDVVDVGIGVQFQKELTNNSDSLIRRIADDQLWKGNDFAEVFAEQRTRSDGLTCGQPDAVGTLSFLQLRRRGVVS